MAAREPLRTGAVQACGTNFSASVYACRVCGDKAKVQSVSVAYAFKLLLQEMQSLNVAPRLLIKERV